MYTGDFIHFYMQINGLPTYDNYKMSVYTQGMTRINALPVVVCIREYAMQYAYLLKL